MPSKQSAAGFTIDFKPLERELARRTSCPVERMIVELGITPSNVRMIERSSGVGLPWFFPAYTVMKRHGLEPTDRSWENWIKRYKLAKKNARRKFATKAYAKWQA